MPKKDTSGEKTRSVSLTGPATSADLGGETWTFTIPDRLGSYMLVNEVSRGAIKVSDFGLARSTDESRLTAAALRKALNRLLSEHKELMAALSPLAAATAGTTDILGTTEVRSSWAAVLFADIVGFDGRRILFQNSR